MFKNDEINGFYECKDFMNKRLLNFREKSNPIAADGQIWSLECDFNGAVHGYVSLFIVNQSCNALKLDPPSLREIKVVLFNPKELHCQIKKTLPVEQKSIQNYRFLKFAKLEEIVRLGIVDLNGSINFRFYVKRNNIKKKLSQALEREKRQQKRNMVAKLKAREDTMRSWDHQQLINFIQRYKAEQKGKRRHKSVKLPHKSSLAWELRNIHHQVQGQLFSCDV